MTPGHHDYNYSRSLPGGGSITNVTVSSSFGGSAQMTGTDNDGNNFITSYRISHGKLEHTVIGPMGRPTFTQDDISLLFEVGRAFVRAYGLE